MAAAGVATNVVTLMTNLTSAAEIAGKMASTANTVCETVTAIANKSHETLMELSKEAANISADEVSDFREALRETQSSGEALRQRCLELSQKWDSFETYVSNMYRQKQIQIGQSEVQKCIGLLKIMLECAALCNTKYKEFKEKLHTAIDVGSRLVTQSKVAAQDARSEASNTRAVGYGATGALGVTALGFVTFATGGLALVGAAAAGAAAAGAGRYTYDRANRLDKLTKEFDDLRKKLDSSLGELNKLGDSITGLFAVTEKMVENMEIVLKFFKEQERLRLENEERMLENESIMRENEELHTRIQELEDNERKKREREIEENEENMRNNERIVQRNEELERRIQELELAGKMKP